MGEKLNREQAQKEVESWLDYKKISPKKREFQANSIESIIDSFVDGHLALKEDTKVIVQNLKFPTEGEKPITQLEFKPRLNTGTAQQHLQGVKSDDTDGRICAIIAALTGNPRGLVNKLDTEDYAVAQSIALLFF